MAYRRKAARKSYGRKTTFRRAPVKRRAAPKRRKTASKRKSASRSHQKITLVIQQAPVGNPTLATPAAKARPVRARFGG